jgi:hypothetical protein
MNQSNVKKPEVKPVAVNDMAIKTGVRGGGFNPAKRR